MAESEVQESKGKVAAKAAPAPKDERLETLRAQLNVAEHAVSDVPEDAPDEVKEAASKVKADAEKALADAHITEQKKVEERTREVRDLSLQELNQSASTQNVRGTHELTPEEHARRRNPR